LLQAVGVVDSCGSEEAGMQDRRDSRVRTVRFAAFAALLAVASVAAQAGGVYRWVDDDGNVHYGDRMPAEATHNEHAVLDHQGIVRERVAAESRVTRTPDPAVQAVREAAARRRHRDEVLLETFTTERDLRITRDQRLDGIDARIALAEQKVAQLESERTATRDRVSNLPKDAPARRQAGGEVDVLNDRLARHRQRLQDLQQQRNRVAEQFAEDLERFRELKSGD